MADDQLQRLFPGLDLDAFWVDSEYAHREYGEGFPSDALIASVEADLGFRLPASYVALMRSRNGGMPRNTCCPAPSRTTWAEDHIEVTGIMGIGREKDCSLAGRCGSRFFTASSNPCAPTPTTPVHSRDWPRRDQWVAYPSDLTDGQWAVVGPFLDAAVLG